MEVVVARVAGLDVHQDTVMAAVRVPDEKGGRSQTVREFRTFTADLVALRDWLASHRGDPGDDGGHRGVLEATMARPRRSGTLGADAGQRPPRQEPPGPQDRRVRRLLVGAAGRV